MPTILRQNGFRVIIYLNDHLPSHVHILKGGGEIKIDLGNSKSKPKLIAIVGAIKNQEVAKALELVTDNQAFLLAKWKEIHG